MLLTTIGVCSTIVIFVLLTTVGEFTINSLLVLLVEFFSSSPVCKKNHFQDSAWALQQEISAVEMYIIIRIVITNIHFSKHFFLLTLSFELNALTWQWHASRWENRVKMFCCYETCLLYFAVRQLQLLCLFVWCGASRNGCRLCSATRSRLAVLRGSSVNDPQGNVLTGQKVEVVCNFLQWEWPPGKLADWTKSRSCV